MKIFGWYFTVSNDSLLDRIIKLENAVVSAQLAVEHHRNTRSLVESQHNAVEARLAQCAVTIQRVDALLSEKMYDEAQSQLRVVYTQTIRDAKGSDLISHRRKFGGLS